MVASILELWLTPYSFVASMSSLPSSLFGPRLTFFDHYRSRVEARNHKYGVGLAVAAGLANAVHISVSRNAMERPVFRLNSPVSLVTVAAYQPYAWLQVNRSGNSVVTAAPRRRTNKV